MQQLDIILRTEESYYNMTFDVSSHCQDRMAQRGISTPLLSLALLYGKLIAKQGLSFYYVRAKDLPGHINPDIHHKLNNMVVVCDDDKGVIITVYHAYKGLTHLKKKTKQLKLYAA